MPVNQQELEVCRRRGHDAPLMDAKRWTQCRWCGIWLRAKEIIEEREDDPPQAEQNPLHPLKRI